MITNRALLRHAAALALSLCVSATATAAVTITIVNRNGPGEGFNDSTPAAPVGGNSGVTLGQQRLIAFRHAANIWGRNLTSAVPIRIDAAFVPLPCTEDGAVLGAAGALEIFTDFPNAPRPATWYSGALASKLAAADVASPGRAHIRARFNSRLGLSPDCLPGAPFYLGIDNQHGEQIDLVSVLLHEIAHGLGFQNFTDEETGEQFDKLPSVWDFHLVDNRTETRWVDMNNEERRRSAISGNSLSWNGQNVRTYSPQVLAPQSRLSISGPAAGIASGDYEVGDATFGPPLSENALRGQLMPIVDQPNGVGFACTPLSYQNATAVRGNIALVDRGGCAFVIKARIVQNAGAIGMLVAENVAGPVTPLGGTDELVSIPAVRISLEAGRELKRVTQRRSRTASGVIAELGIDPNMRQGADRLLRVRMHAPPEYQPGSSISHFTVDARPNQLMEPSINPDLPHEVRPPRDLTLPLLHDIGW